jgi:transcriptional regulator with XRE-family HTH domain
MDKLGERIRHMRQDRGLSLADLSAKTGISKGHLSTVERDLSPRVSVDTFAAIADALGVPMQALYYGAVPDPSVVYDRENEPAPIRVDTAARTYWFEGKHDDVRRMQQMLDSCVGKATASTVCPSPSSARSSAPAAAW